MGFSEVRNGLRKLFIQCDGLSYAEANPFAWWLAISWVMSSETIQQRVCQEIEIDLKSLEKPQPKEGE